jgi:hypothetical protein
LESKREVKQSIAQQTNLRDFVQEETARRQRDEKEKDDASRMERKRKKRIE